MKEDALPDGLQFEVDVFGIHADLSDNPGSRPYVRFEIAKAQAIAMAKRRGWNPHEPAEHLLIRKLLDEVRSIFAQKQLPYTVEVWPGIGTFLDYIHGVDGLFIAHAPGRNTEACLLFDLSLGKNNPKKRIRILKRRSFGWKLTGTATSIAECLHSSLTTKTRR